MANPSLKEIFCSQKEEFASSLEGLTLPKDSSKIQKNVSKYFSHLFENDGPYRQSLTESEDYVLMSVLQIIESQQALIEEISKAPMSTNGKKEENESQKKTVNPYVALAGTGVGALVGGIAGTWTAVAGSIAGTALGIYYCSNHKFDKCSIADNKEVNNKNEDNVDVNAFVDIVEMLCESIDLMLDTFRTQMQRMKNVYENRPKENFLRDYDVMSEKMELLLSAIHAHCETIPAKVLQRATMLEESLENYGIKYDNGKLTNIQ